MTLTVRTVTEVAAANRAYPSRPMTCPTPPSPRASAASVAAHALLDQHRDQVDHDRERREGDQGVGDGQQHERARCGRPPRPRARSPVTARRRAPGSAVAVVWPPGVVQAPPVQRDGDERPARPGAPGRPGASRASRRARRPGARRRCWPGRRPASGWSARAPGGPAPAGQRGERRRVQRAGHRDPGHHPADVEHGQVRRQGDGGDAGDGDQRGGRHHLARAEVVDVSPDPDPDAAGDELGQRERAGDRRRSTSRCRR